MARSRPPSWPRSPANRQRAGIVAGDEDDGEIDFRFRKFALEVEPAHSRQPDIEHEAARDIGSLALQELLRRPEHADLQPNGTNKTLQSIANRLFVIDYENDGLCLSHVTPRTQETQPS